MVSGILALLRKQSILNTLVVFKHQPRNPQCPEESLQRFKNSANNLNLLFHSQCVNCATNQVMAAGNKNIGSIIFISDYLDSTSKCAYNRNICIAVMHFPSLSMTFLDLERRRGFLVYPMVDQVFNRDYWFFRTVYEGQYIPGISLPISSD